MKVALDSLRKAVVPIAVFALGLVGCSSGASSRSAINDAGTPHTPITPSAHVVALATKFRCDGVRPKAEDQPGVGFTPVEIYDCALPRGLNTSIVAYTPAQVRKLREPATLRPVCDAVKRYPEVTAIYAVYGNDYVASVQVGGDNLPNGPKTFEARSKALARALGIPLTTVPCD